MVHFAFATVLLAAASAFVSVSAAPTVRVESRQLGGILADGLTCNVARVRIVAGLAATNRALGRIDTAADPAADAALAATQAGVAEAQAGISTIADALVAGEEPPAAGREQTEAGLTAAKTALDGIADLPGAAAAVRALDRSIAAGQDVVANC